MAIELTLEVHGKRRQFRTEVTDVQTIIPLTTAGGTGQECRGVIGALEE